MDLDSKERRIAVVHVMHGKGLVWDADDAYWLREKHRIVGSMVGGVSAFKQQNLVHGLPLQLCPEEVTVLKELGLIKLETFKLGERNAEHLKSVSHLASNQNDAHASTSNSDSDEESTASEETKQWQRALAEGSEFLVPVHKADNLSGEETAWPFPRTDEERCRYLVFRDLHKRGFSITAGSKFGADFLLYPGDPTQFHAQFCVRMMRSDEPLVPCYLSAACRGSFQARKHLLYAFVNKSDEIVYTTFGQIGGFG
eukprot:jgi/Picsp_1/2252/NSC_05716-R1_trna-splicing endonuclease subunit sen34-like